MTRLTLSYQRPVPLWRRTNWWLLAAFVVNVGLWGLVAWTLDGLR